MAMRSNREKETFALICLQFSPEEESSEEY